MIAFLVYQTGGSIVLTDQELHDIADGKYMLAVQDNADMRTLTYYAKKEGDVAD